MRRFAFRHISRVQLPVFAMSWMKNQDRKACNIDLTPFPLCNSRIVQHEYGQIPE